MTSVSVFQPARSRRQVAAPGLHSVPLVKMPDALNSPEPLQFPESLADRIWFDSDRKRLVFQGFMSKATYDRLDALSNDDVYQRALDELFRQSVYEEPVQRQRRLHKVVPIAAVVTLALLALTLAIPLCFLAMRL